MTNKEFFQARYATEAGITSRVLGAAPTDKLGWRPHDRSRSAEEIMGHMIGHEQDLLQLMEAGRVDHRMQVPFRGTEQAVKLFNEARGAVEKKLATVDEGSWNEKKGQFCVEGHVIMEAPWRDIAWLLFFDSLHHRGQLSAYLRPMGGKVPSIYGPSADDAGGGH